MKFLATFHTQYGAMQFRKYCWKEGISAKMGPVPRELSASCGVCVRFEDDNAPIVAEYEDMESCYVVTGEGKYIQAKHEDK